MGRKKRPLYAVVAADSRSPRDGRYIEDLGRYEPLQEPAMVDLKQDRILYWLQQGAQPSDTVRSLLSREGLMLALHMTRKGAEEEAIAQAVAEHRERLAAKWAARTKTTAKDRKQAMLAAEDKVASERAAELAKLRADAEAKAREAAEAAQKEAAEERARAAEEAKRAQEEANEATAGEVKKAQKEANAATAAADDAAAAEAEAPAKAEAPAADAATDKA
ncbi:MAG: 30S ribosomal protein S16 [Rhodothermales bacterium]|nr:30S ribosomal protein S16 [Rhodothermales bacterium]